MGSQDQAGAGGPLPEEPDRRAAPEALGEVLRVLQSFHGRYVADRAAGAIRPVEEYAALFPGFADIVREQYRSLREEDPPVHVPSSVSETLDRLVAEGPRAIVPVKEIARGGMGVVYRVRDEVLHRDLAMKVMLDEASRIPVGDGPARTDTVQATAPLRRMLQEAQITAQLSHPGIVPVHELGIDREGRLFFTMKMVRGRTLHEIFALVRERREDWSQTRALQVVLRICETLAFAHSKGVIHRDIKPSNIMVGPFGEVYVMDWGVAKVLHAEPGDEPPAAAGARPSPAPDVVEPDPVTRMGDVVGTPEYMPPEQALGYVEDLDRRTDVYSIGAILYELLTGDAPYSDPTGPRVPARILKSVALGLPDPVEGRAPHVPPELVAICRKAMARERAGRYQTAEELSNDLHRYLEGRVVLAYRTGPVVELRSWIRRNSVLAATGAASLLVLIAGSVWYGVEQQRFAVDLAAQRDAALAAEIGERAERRKAVGLRLAAQAGTEVEKAPALALQLAVEAAERAPGAASRDALYQALARHHERRRLLGHDGYVLAGGWSPDGKRVLTIEWGDCAILWDAETGALLHRLLGHEEQVYAAAFSPDGARVATTGREGTARLSDAATGKTLRVLSGHRGAIAAVAFSPDGRTLATAGDDRTVRLWSVAAGEEVRVLEGHEGPVRDVAFSPSGDRLASIGGDATCRVFDPATGAPLLVLPTRTGPPDLGPMMQGPVSGASVMDRVLFAAGGRVLLTWTRNGVLRLHAIEGGAARLTLDREDVSFPSLSGDGSRVAAMVGTKAGGHCIQRWEVSDPGTSTVVPIPQPLVAVALDRRGRRVAGTVDFDTEVWDLETGRRACVLRGHRYTMKSVSWSPDDTRILTTSADQTARIWEAEPPDAVRIPPGIRADRVSPDGRRRVEVEGDPAGPAVSLAVVESASGNVVARFPAEGPVQALRWLPDGRHLLLNTGERLRVLVAATGAEVGRIPAPPGGFAGRHVVVGPDRLHVLLKGHGPNLLVGDLAAGTWAPPPKGLGGIGCALSPDGRRILAIDPSGRKGEIWDEGAARTVHFLTGSKGFVVEAAWSPDGKRVATSAIEGRVRVWDPETGALVSVAGPVPARNNFLEVDGIRRRMTAVCAGEANLFDTETGERVATLRETGEYGRIDSAVFLRDSEEISTVSGNGTLVRRWALDPLPVARGRIPIELEPSVVRRFQVLPPGEADAYEEGWLRRHPTARSLSEKGVELLGKGSAAEAMAWIEAARALRPGLGEVAWGEACVRARRSTELPDGPARAREREQALDALARALKGEAATPDQARNEAYLAPLRDDPRFKAIVGE